MQKKIIIINHYIFRSIQEIDSSILLKLYDEFSENFNIEVIIYAYYEFDSLIQKKYLHIYKLKKYKLKLFNIINYIKIYFFNIKFIKTQKNYDMVWIPCGAPGIIDFFYFIYKLLFSRKFFFIQLMSPSVGENKFRRFFYDLILKYNLKCFNFIGTGHEGYNNLIKKFDIPNKKIVPIGIAMPDYGLTIRDFSFLKLFYLGTLTERDVWKTIEGLYLFKEKNPDIFITYDIIGTGKYEDVEKLKKIINHYKLNHIVTYHGALTIEEVKKIMNKCNIGVAFCPIKEYFNNPSNKTIEYLLSGMAVIATNDEYKSQLISPDVGVLCKDNSIDFALGLKSLHHNKVKYKSLYIREKFIHFSMRYDVKNQHVKYLNDIMKNN